MAEKDSYDADREDDKGKQFKQKKGEENEEVCLPWVSMEQEVFFRIEDNMGGDNDLEVIISILAEKIGQKNSGSEAQDEMEVATSNGFDDDSDKQQQFCEFNYESKYSSDSDWI